MPLFCGGGQHVLDFNHFFLLGSCQCLPRRFPTLHASGNRNINPRGFYEQLFRSIGEVRAAQRARLKNAELPQCLNTLLVKIMFAGKGTESRIRQNSQTNRARFSTFFCLLICCHRGVGFLSVGSPLLGSDARSLVAILPVLFLACLAAIMSCFTLPTRELGSTRPTV